MASQPFSSVMVPRCTNQYICRASQKSRGAWAGTRRQTAAMRASSALRAGSGSVLALLPGQVGVALGKDDGRVAGDVHGLELLGPIRGQGVAEIIEAAEALGDALLEVQHAHFVDRPVQGRVAGGALFHELGEQSGLVGGPPLVRNLGEDPFAHGAARPVGDDLAFVGRDVLLVDMVAGHGPGGQHAQVFSAVAGQLREGRHAFGPGAAFADDEFVVTEVDGFLFAQVPENQGAQHGQGVLAVVFAVEAVSSRARSMEMDGLAAKLSSRRRSILWFIYPPMRTRRPQSCKIFTARSTSPVSDEGMSSPG
jgi:hypothetical protein